MDNKDIKILFLDDEKDITDLFGKLFSKKGYTSLTATSAEEAIDIFLKEKPQICIFDIVLIGSRLNGIETWEKVRPENKDSICIFFSRKIDEDTKERANQAEMYAFIEKPFLPSKLLEIIEKAAGSLGKNK